MEYNETLSEHENYEEFPQGEDLDQIFSDWMNFSDENFLQHWEDLPDMGLYMDQVIKYMGNQLERSRISENEKNITASMINNYTKEGLVARPDRKRYSKKHLASLTIVCLLKQVLPMLSIKQLFDYINSAGDGFPKIYDSFCDSQKQAFNETTRYAYSSVSAGSSKRDRCMLAIELATKANVLRVASERLIASLDEKE